MLPGSHKLSNLILSENLNPILFISALPLPLDTTPASDLSQYLMVEYASTCMIFSDW